LNQSQDDAVARAAKLIAGALNELSVANQENSALAEEISRNRIAMEALSQRFEQQMAEERAQRRMLADQIAGLAGSLDRLVTHLEGASTLMAELVARISQPYGAPPRELKQTSEPGEPLFQPGGEGISLVVSGVPGFQTLMDIQKALVAMEPVESASVERFQEGDSRIQLHLTQAVSGSYLAAMLGEETSHSFVVEEARPELMSLRIKVVA
jgi:hypothetical protein